MKPVSHILELVEAEHIREERAHPRFEPGRSQQPIDLPHEPFVGRELSPVGSEQQRVVRSGVPQEVAEPRGDAVIGQPQPLRIIGIGDRTLHAEEELGRDQQARDHKAETCVEVAQIARGLVGDGDAPGDVLVVQRPAQ